MNASFPSVKVMMLKFNGIIRYYTVMRQTPPLRPLPKGHSARVKEEKATKTGCLHIHHRARMGRRPAHPRQHPRICRHGRHRRGLGPRRRASIRRPLRRGPQIPHLNPLPAFRPLLVSIRPRHKPLMRRRWRDNNRIQPALGIRRRRRAAARAEAGGARAPPAVAAVPAVAGAAEDEEPEGRDHQDDGHGDDDADGDLTREGDAAMLGGCGGGCGG